MPATAQIVIPGLFDLPLHELDPELLQQGLPGINRVLRLANPVPNAAYSIDAILGNALKGRNSLEEQSSGLPMAQAFAGTGPTETDNLLLCQPVHLRPDMNSAVIVPVPLDTENLDDINIVINDLNELFNVDYYMSAVDKGIFLVNLKQIRAPDYYPHVLSVLGKTVNPYLELARQNMPWYKLLNEIQMFLHQHEVNQQRQLRDQLPINSLWFWGAGSNTTTVAENLAWLSDDRLLNRFAESLGLESQSCSEVGGLDGTRDALIVDLRLLEFLKAGLAVPLEQLLRDIDSKLIMPLLALVDKNSLQLVLRAGYEFDFELKPWARMKFWRQRSNLAVWTGAATNPG